jgi:hypothetical protein
MPRASKVSRSVRRALCRRPKQPLVGEMRNPSKPLLAPNIYPLLTMLGGSRRLHHQSAGRFKWIRAWKTAFASARTRSGPHMVACTAKPISIGLQPSGKSWRHQRPRSPANRPLKRHPGRLHVRRPPERSRWPANAAHHTRNASACSAAIRTLSGCHGLGM